jgi:sulfur-oxidizing protein SoxA
MKRIALALLACCSIASAEERRSGLLDMRPEAQAMQRDDSMNPGMLWVLDGEALWGRKPAPAAQACVDCHGDAANSMRGVAARYPAFDAASGAAIDLSGRIIQCREARQARPPLARESQELLALTSFIAHQSRSLPIAPPDDTGMRAVRTLGQRIYMTRMGQLDLSCGQCHDDHAGRRLAGSVSSSTAKPWFWLVMLTRPVSRSFTGWLAPWWLFCILKVLAPEARAMIW